MKLRAWSLFVLLSTAVSAFAMPIAVQDMSLNVPDGWRLAQDARDNGTLILGFDHGDDYLSLYVRQNTLEDMRGFFANESQVLTEGVEKNRAGISWDLLKAVHQPELKWQKIYYVSAFKTEFRGYTYYGYLRSTSLKSSDETVRLFLNNLDTVQTRSIIGTRSLTGPDFTGKKYYLGFGDAHPGSSSMVNEVKYDVKHTSDIFSKDVGGNYIGQTSFGDDMEDDLLNRWRELNNKMTANDMYIQYSSGHGYTGGLGNGVSYNQIRDNTLSMPAKEIVIFIMACNSGGLVDSFNAKKSVWLDWQSQGRTLIVMASSKTSESSSTGPGTDPDEPGAPNGSAGSAFGHALWKALIGYADGQVDGVKDQYIDLGEIRDYSKKKTQQVGGHTPVTTGVYNASLKMNRVPPKAWVDALEHTTEGMSDEQVMEKIRELDQELRVN